MASLARFANKYDKLSRKIKLHKKYIKLKEPTIRSLFYVIKIYIFRLGCEIFKASSANLKLQKFTLEINSILNKGLCYFYKFMEIFEALFFSISL